MLSLSFSLTDHRVYVVQALVDGVRYRTALTHPFDAESRFDNPAYKRWLWNHMQHSHSATYKDLVRLARAHIAGKNVILRLHQNAQHGDILLAALRYVADRLPPLPKAHGTSPHHGFAVWSDREEEELLDERRFIWVVGRTEAKLAYLWDTEGVLTALIPGHGLVKVGRCVGTFWSLRRQSPHINAYVQVAQLRRHGLSAEMEQTFERLVKRQQQAERVEVARYHTGVEFDVVEKIAYEDRYDPWLRHEEELLEEEPPTLEETVAHVETAAFFRLYSTRRASEFARLLPTRYRGEHVKPVIKTKADGSRWVLSPDMQARGALHLYQCLA